MALNKNTYLSELARKLRRLPKQDYEDALRYYEEFFLDSGVDDTTDVIPLVGNVDEVAARILEECKDRQIEKVESEGGIKNSTKAIWYVILGIFAAPIAFPLAIVVAAVLFALLVTLFAVIFSLIVASFCIVVAGIVAIPAIFWAESGSQVLILLGMSLMSISLGVLLCIGFYKLGELAVKGIIRLIHHIDNSMKKNNGTQNSRQQSYGHQNGSYQSANNQTNTTEEQSSIYRNAENVTNASGEEEYVESERVNLSKNNE